MNLDGTGGASRREKKRPAEVKRERLRLDTRMEISLGALNVYRYHRHYRETLIRTKIPDIVGSAEIAWQILNRGIDLKDYRISVLMDALHSAEDQYLRKESALASAIDRSLRIHETRLRSNEEALFRQRVNEATSEGNVLLVDAIVEYAESERFLREIDSLSKREFEDSASDARSRALSKLDVFIEDAKDVRRVAVAQLNNRLEDLWGELRDVLTEYKRRTENRQKSYEAMEREDVICRGAIARRALRTATLFEEIRKLGEKTTSYRTDVAKEMEMEMEAVAGRSNFFVAAYRRAEQNFFADRKHEAHRATVMSIEYNRTAKHLRALASRAEIILRLMQICRKYETRDEKVKRQMSGEIIEEPANTVPSSLDRCSSVIDKMSASLFWRQLATARTVLAELCAERNDLSSRKTYLSKSVKRRLSGQKY